MIPLTLAEVTEAVDGRLCGPADPTTRVTGSVEFDSRRIGPGGLFLALPGDRVDGHEFAAAAVAAGAVAVLASDPIDASLPAILVADGQRAYGRLAHAVLARLAALTVVSVTGSSGKTSTKDLLAHLLAQFGPTVAPPGSFNNEIGLPHTVLRADEDTRYLVLENSARGVGHIAALCAIAPPRIGAVLNVGTAHLGEFGSRENIARSKAELVQALPAAADGGLAVLAADDPLVAAMAASTSARVISFGCSPGADVRAEDIRLDPLGRPSYTLVAAAGRVPVTLALHGAHHVGNSLAAAAVALELGLDLAGVARALGTARATSRWRMEVTERADGVLIVNDAYNANPESMRAALTALSAMAGTRRSWAVLGEMGELGEQAGAEHRAVGQLARQLGIDRLVLVGPAAAEIGVGFVGGCDGGSCDAAPDVVPGTAPDVVPGIAPDVDAAVELLRVQLRPGDVVLVKASRAAGLERVALALAVDGPGDSR